MWLDANASDDLYRCMRLPKTAVSRREMRCCVLPHPMLRWRGIILAAVGNVGSNRLLASMGSMRRSPTIGLSPKTACQQLCEDKARSQEGCAQDWLRTRMCLHPWSCAHKPICVSMSATLNEKRPGRSLQRRWPQKLGGQSTSAYPTSWTLWTMLRKAERMDATFAARPTLRIRMIAVGNSAPPTAMAVKAGGARRQSRGPLESSQYLSPPCSPH